MTEANTELIEKLPSIALYQVLNVAVKYLRESEYNPRTIDEDQLKALKISLTENKDFLKARPPIINAAMGREGVIIAGNQRVRAAIELGWETVPVMFVKAETIAKEMALNLLDNKNSGNWDNDKLQNVVMELHSFGYDMTTIGHTATEITNIMSGQFQMGDPKDSDDYKKNGTTPAGKWVRCPECQHEFKVTKKEKISDPTADAELPS